MKLNLRRDCGFDSHSRKNNYFKKLWKEEAHRRVPLFTNKNWTEIREWVVFKTRFHLLTLLSTNSWKLCKIKLKLEANINLDMIMISHINCLLVLIKTLQL